MGSMINPNLEFCEIINAFPILEESLERLNVDISDLRDGQSLYEYFEGKSYSEDEIDILIKKLNSDLNYYFKKGKFPESNIRNQKEVLGVSSEECIECETEDMEEYEEEE